MHTVFAFLCFVVVIHWLIFPYPSGLLHWHCGNLTIAPVPAKQPWWIWINTSCESIMNDCITTTKQSTTKPCAYFLGYTVCATMTRWVNMIYIRYERGIHAHASSITIMWNSTPHRYTCGVILCICRNRVGGINIKMPYCYNRDFIIKMNWSKDQLNFKMGIPIFGKMVFILKWSVIVWQPGSRHNDLSASAILHVFRITECLIWEGMNAICLWKLSQG